jgi:hypothetical protein
MSGFKKSKSSRVNTRVCRCDSETIERQENNKNYRLKVFFEVVRSDVWGTWQS